MTIPHVVSVGEHVFWTETGGCFQVFTKPPIQLVKSAKRHQHATTEVGWIISYYS